MVSSDAPPEKGNVTKGGAFELLRLAAAVFVVFSHCYPLTGQDAREPLSSLTTGGAGFGEVAVYVFFAISGYLVTQSWMRDASPARFMMRRALRIFPALAFVIVASLALVGSLTTTLSLSDYFSKYEARAYLAKILIYPTQYGLPGVFERNPFPGVVNGSLWSLRLEFAFYIVVAVLGVLGFLRSRLANVALAAVCLIMSVIVTQTTLLNGLPFLRQSAVLFLNGAPFFIGAALAQGSLDSTLICGAAAFLVSLAVLFIATPAFKFLLIVAVPFVVILAGRYSKVDLRGDYSYGIYLWSFPVQQSVVHFAPTIQPIELFAIAAPIIFVFAFISWHLVEKHAIALKPARANLNNHINRVSTVLLNGSSGNS